MVSVPRNVREGGMKNHAFTMRDNDMVCSCGYVADDADDAAMHISQMECQTEDAEESRQEMVRDAMRDRNEQERIERMRE